MHGKNENVSIWPMIWCAATSSVLRRNTRPDRKRIPKLNVALSRPDGRLIAKSVRVVGRVSRHRPPAMLRPATPRMSRATTTITFRIQTIDDA